MVFNKSKIQLAMDELKYMFFKKKYMALVDITDKCNLRCKYCYHKDYLSSEDNTTLEEWERRFREYRKMGIRYITLLGGEPSLRYDVLQLAENYFFFVEVTTNGQIKIPEEFNHRIFLSLEGLEEEHDEICGKGTFKKAVNNYSGDKRVFIYTTLSRDNYKTPQRLKEFIDFIKKMGVKGIRFGGYMPKIGEDDFLLLTASQRQEIKKVLLEELKDKKPILSMTIGMVNSLVNSFPPKDNCSYKNKAYFFDAHNNKKECVNYQNDCNRCFNIILRYNPPFYNFWEYLSYKWLQYKALP